MKQFTILCDFRGQKSPVTFYIGKPHPDKHPINFQQKWLSSDKGGNVPQDVMDSIQKLYGLAKKNGVEFEELCYYAMVNSLKKSNKS